MDVTAITTFIQNLGFPIACVIMMFYQLSKEQENHKEETTKLTETLHNNTVAIVQLTEYLKRESKNDG